MAGDFRLTSSDFSEGDAIPRRHTCDGEDVSPVLEWSGAPDEAQALVLIVDDPDARGFVHWIVYDMTPTQSGGLPEGFSESPDAPAQGTNDFRRTGYGGPCPPSGTHRYDFTLYALSEPTGLSGSPRADEVRAALSGRIIAEARLSGTYTRSR
jgi:Raf kinase inhibitor-like YbhB/YbcL family protein